MSARVVTSTPVLTPRGSVARGRSNGSVSRIVVVGGEGSLSRVVVARARADGKMTAKETTKTTMVALAPVVSGACCAEAANAAVDPIASALAAYGHYLGLVLVVGALATEKWTVKANMSEEEEQRLVVADSVYGIAGVLVLYTGYLRATEYGKGWEFYSHEPIFWVKMWLFTVMGSSSLFPTIQIIKRAAAKAKGDVEPMSEKLATRTLRL